MTESFFYVVGPEKFDEAFKTYKGLLFPEEKYDQIAYIRKARNMFDRLRDLDLTLKPLSMKGAPNGGGQDKNDTNQKKH